MLAACRRRNSAQLESSWRGAGSIPASRRIAQTVLAASEIPSPTSSPLDPPVTPAGILARQPRHQLAHVDRRRRTSGTAVGIRPEARHQFAVPAKKRRRGDKERPPSGPRQHAAEHGEQDPIARAKLRTRDLPLKHQKLVTQYEDFDLLLPLRPHAQDEQLEEAPSAP